MYCRKTFEELLDVNGLLRPFSFDYNGEPCDLSKAPCHVEIGNGGHRTMAYEVVPGKLRVTLDMIIWPDYPVIEYTPYFENIGDEDTGIISEVSDLDYTAEDPVTFGLQKLNEMIADGNSRITIRYSLGSKASGADFLPQKKDLFSRPGSNKLELECSGGWCSTDFMPFIGIDNDPMNGVNLAIGWNCGWKFTAEKEINQADMGRGKMSRIRIGMVKAAFRLHPGEKVMRPGILLHFRENKSIRDGQNQFRHFMIEHHSPRNSRGELIKPMICNATWGGLDTDKQLKNIQLVHDKQLPYENWWIDAGWMGSATPCPHFLEKSKYPSDWFFRVGSWNINTYVHPNGLRPISDALHKAGMRLLVWFEASRISFISGSKLLKEHPEWLIGDHEAAAAGNETGSFLINLGIPEARENVLNTISEILEREGIDDYREDLNNDPARFFPFGDAPDRIGISEMQYVEGFYLFWEGLRKRFPDMCIDNCSGGGRRLDYKTASLSFPLCQSDFASSYFPIDVECLQLENMYLDDWVPVHGTMNWGEDDLYHAASGLGSGFAGMVWCFNGREAKEDHDYETHRKLLQWAIQLRDIHLTGDVYPLVENPENDLRTWNGQQINDPVQNYGMVQIYRRKQSTEPDFRLKLMGIKPDGIYNAEFFTGESTEMTGRELASLEMHLDKPESFQFIRYRLVR